MDDAEAGVEAEGGSTDFTPGDADYGSLDVVVDDVAEPDDSDAENFEDGMRASLGLSARFTYDGGHFFLIGKPTGEDPCAKAIHRIVDVLAGEGPGPSGSHVPYRDSSLTKLIAPALGGSASAAHLLHVRSDKYDEADAMLGYGRRLEALPHDRCALETVRGFPLNVEASLRAAHEKADAACAALGVGPREGLHSSSIALDHDSSDELLELQKALRLGERLEHRRTLWNRVRALRRVRRDHGPHL